MPTPLNGKGAVERAAVLEHATVPITGARDFQCECARFVFDLNQWRGEAEIQHEFVGAETSRPGDDFVTGVRI